MKKLICIFVFLLAYSAIQSSAQIMQGICGGSGTAECDTASESQEGATVTSDSIAYTSYILHAFTNVSISSPETICKISARMLKVGSPTSTVQMCLYDDTGRYTSTTWATNTAYSSASYRVPTTSTTYVYKASGDCTSSTSTEPTWPETIGGSVTESVDCASCCTWTAYYNINPGAEIDCSDALGQASFDTSEGTVTFTGISASLSSGIYFVVAKASGSDTSNYYKWAYATAASGLYKDKASSTLKTPISATIDAKQYKFILYK